MNGMPSLTPQTILSTIERVGVSLALATFLLWLLLMRLPVLDRLSEAMDKHVAEEHVRTVILRAICRNTAKTELQGQFCDYGLPEWNR
jgi:hypothetical protein